jgi:hypothetical protein
MTDKDNENVGLIKELEKREAGVTELFEFYAGIEAVYAASIKALEEGQITLVTNSANNK